MERQDLLAAHAEEQQEGGRSGSAGGSGSASTPSSFDVEDPHAAERLEQQEPQAQGRAGRGRGGGVQRRRSWNARRADDGLDEDGAPLTGDEADGGHGGAAASSWWARRKCQVLLGVVAVCFIVVLIAAVASSGSSSSDDDDDDDDDSGGSGGGGNKDDDDDNGAGPLLVESSLRPAFHVMPRGNWMNDPNGPMYYNGRYHLFFQYNPWGSVWGNMSWGHAVSNDLIYWSHLPVALYNDEPYDINGVFSGSATLNTSAPDEAPVLLYTCVNGSDAEMQCISTPTNASDPNLTNWTKPLSNPVIPVSPPGYSTQQFRDPSTAWRAAGLWYMTAAIKKGSEPTAILYSSPDLATWTYAGDLTNLTALDITYPDDMWECPDMFPLREQVTSALTGLYIFKFSLMDVPGVVRSDRFVVGTYDNTTQKFIRNESFPVRMYDYGTYYASKSFFDSPNNRQVLWGWSTENETDAPVGQQTRGWAGVQSLPRVVVLDESTQVVRTMPSPELSDLRHTTAALDSGTMDASSSPDIFTRLDDTDGLQLELSATFTVDARDATADVTDCLYGFRVRHSVLSADDDADDVGNVWNYTGVYTSLSFASGTNVSDATLYVDKRHSGGTTVHAPFQGALPDAECCSATGDSVYTVTLDVWVDHSVVEAFTNAGSTAITARIYNSPNDTAVSLVNADWDSTGTSGDCPSATVVYSTWAVNSIWLS